MTPAALASGIARDVLDGLTAFPKRLPPRLFYDAEGSALFEAITELPEYYPTRTERAILARHAPEIVERAGSGLCLVELGAGTASKTRLLIEALLARQGRTAYYPVDVSASAMEIAALGLREAYPSLELHPVVAHYGEGLNRMREVAGPKLVLFLGSSIGNFETLEAAAFLQGLRGALAQGDALLIGMDLAKDLGILIPAYDDAQGVTAAFNRNVLARINRELGGSFEPESFRHVALWNGAESRIEMHLESRMAQRVAIEALDLKLSFEAGERIHTEHSTKYTLDSAEGLLRTGGFAPEARWEDPQGWFSVWLARVA